MDFTDNTKQNTKDYVVAKSNKLIQSSKIDLTLYEHRVVNYMISKILATDTAFDFVTIDYQDFCHLCNIKDTNLSYVKMVIKTLSDRSWFYFDGKRDILVRWIGEAEISGESIQLKFHPQMARFLLQLKDGGNYTQTQLFYYLQFRGKYTPILYDYCRSYANLIYQTKTNYIERVLDIDVLREKLGLKNQEKNKYPLYKDVRVNVLEPCINEINAITDINVSFTALKAGKKVTHIKLSISVKDIEKRIKLWNNLP